jgi:hypothetical protein
MTMRFGGVVWTPTDSAMIFEARNRLEQQKFPTSGMENPF